MTWKHKGLKKFFYSGSKSGIQARHAHNLRLRLAQLACAVKPDDMNIPGNGFHRLKGKLKDYYAVKVSGNWRVIFRFDGRDVYDVDYLDYH